MSVLDHLTALRKRAVTQAMPTTDDLAIAKDTVIGIKRHLEALRKYLDSFDVDPANEGEAATPVTQSAEGELGDLAQGIEDTKAAFTSVLDGVMGTPS